jgi:pimeloyl-ACP methyl ester carboxylesterase
MPIVPANGIEIAYEAWGDHAATPVLLLPGLGRQIVEWEPDFISAIAGSGYRIIAVDQRDTGLSTHFDGAGKAPLREIRELRDRGEPLPVAYTVTDMARDALGVLDALDIARVHLVGFSLGGMVAQEMAGLGPRRLLSLASVMATTGDLAVGGPSPAGIKALFHAPPPDREGAITAAVDARRMIATPGQFDERSERLRAAAAFDRSFNPAGAGRQLAAIWAAGDRTTSLRTMSVPTLVIHGSVDPLVDVSGGRATAAAIPGARLVVIEGMAHDIPKRFVGRLVEELVTHFEASGSEPRIENRESR